MELRPYQKEAAERFAKMGQQARLLFAWKPGAGKTIGALAAMEARDVDRLLIVCPAIVRPMWLKTLKTYWPERQAGAIYASRDCRRLTKGNALALAAAYESHTQIVSYDLLGQVDAAPWHGIIIDEVHALQNPRSKQAKQVRAVIESNRHAAVLGLSGTLIPNEAKQLYGVLDTFWPNIYGKRTPLGDISYRFLNRYCNREVTPYGVNYYGLRPDRREELEGELLKVTSVVTEQDFAQYLPPLHIEQIYTEPLHEFDIMVQRWGGRAIAQGHTHIGVFTHLRASAKRALDIFGPISHNHPDCAVVFITGEDSPEVRQSKLDYLKSCPKGLLVSTYHALREGISLSFIKAALIAEFTSSVVDMVQFIGRFSRADSESALPTFINVLVGPNDYTKMERLTRRIADINAVLKAGRGEELAAKAFTNDIGEDALDAEIAALLASAKATPQLLLETFEGQEDD